MGKQRGQLHLSRRKVPPIHTDREEERYLGPREGWSQVLMDSSLLIAFVASVPATFR